MPALDGADALFDSRVVVVTGKGGTGKTTTAAALALAGVTSGRRTLLVEVEGRQGLHGLFGTTPWDHREREFRPGLFGAALDPGDAVYEYLEMFYGIRRVQWLMERSSALDFVTTAAPGLRDLLLVGKIYELEARRREDGRQRYDLIVVDAPPTGRIVPFLAAPEAVTEIVRVGPVRRQAGQIREMLRNERRVRIVLVTLLEEMPVQETVEAATALARAGIAIGPVVANGVVPLQLDGASVTLLERLGAPRLRDRAAVAGAALSGPTAELALDLARDHRRRVELQARLRRDVEDRTGRAVLTLPQTAATGLDLDARDLEGLAQSMVLQAGGLHP